MTGKGGVTVKIVDARVTKLEEELNKGLSHFKNELLSATATSPSNTAINSAEIIVKLQVFEDNMKKALDEVKLDLQKLAHRYNILNEKCTKFELAYNSNFILIHGLTEDTNNLCESVIELINAKLNISLNKSDIGQCYPLGKKRDPGSKKPRPVAVQFLSRLLRDQLFFNKKLLKGSKIMFTEFLTLENMKLFKLAKERFGKSAWTQNGIIFISNGTKRFPLKTEEDFNQINIE